MDEVVRNRPVRKKSQKHRTEYRSNPRAVGRENKECDRQRERCRQGYRASPRLNREQVASEKVDRWKASVSLDRSSDQHTHPRPARAEWRAAQAQMMVNAGNIRLRRKYLTLEARPLRRPARFR